MAIVGQWDFRQKADGVSHTDRAKSELGAERINQYL